MATAPLHPRPADPAVAGSLHAVHGHGSGTPKDVPQDRGDRERIRAAARKLAGCLPTTRPLGRRAIESYARGMLEELGLPDSLVGWTMVAVASAYWRAQVETIPYDRRLLLLPHCLRNSETCPAKYDQLGLLCEDCGACRLSELQAEARQLGYRVLIAEGSPAVINMILRGEADALLGAACLHSLEKALDKILLAGIPCMAVPLLSNSCQNTTTDVDWVREMIATPYRPGRAVGQTYVHLLRAATSLFEPDELRRLVPPLRGGERRSVSNGQPLADLDPLAATETIAYDFLLQGGKHFRPFITLAAYEAIRDGDATGTPGATAAPLPDAVKRIAAAIEVFHKASLVHDDIEDDDPFRYGHPAVHRKYGTATAINIGDYLIGLGYRLVAAERAALGAEVVADVLAQLAESHTRLSEGQGAELAWRDARDKRLAPLDALTIYALKTAPAFEAALFAGLRLAGPVDHLRQPAARFARHLGVAFQILNDLDDWQGDPANKRTAGMDLLGGRPTVLWAFALENLDAAAQRELQSLLPAPPGDSAEVLARARSLYERAGVFAQASALVDKHRRRAHEVAASLPSQSLKHLLHYLADTILQ